MKIGIITFWTSEDNYGQVLQCYALQQYLRQNGHDPFLIRYILDNDVQTTGFRKIRKLLNFRKILGHIKYLSNKKKLNEEHKLNNRNFSEFKKKYLSVSEDIYYTCKELKKNPPVADCYIVGSDQIWNFTWVDKSCVNKMIDAYMLNFGSSVIKRLSYAASWGTTSLSSEIISYVSSLLKKFDYVSVREKSGLGLCKLCGIKDAVWDPDPTLLFDENHYKSLYKMASLRKINKPYILLYMLNTKFDFDTDAVYGFAKERNLDVIYVTGNGVVDNKQKYFATIEEWLYLIDSAEYVITNSFHCCVFSSIFHKKYGVIKLDGAKRDRNERLNSLFELLDIDERYINNTDFSSMLKDYKPMFNKCTTKLLEYL